MYLSNYPCLLTLFRTLGKAPIFSSSLTLISSDIKRRLPYIRGQGQWPRMPACDGTGTAERSYPASKVGGDWEELPCIRGQGWWPRGATPRPRSVAARRRHPVSEASGSREETPRIRGQEQSWGATWARGQGQRPGGGTRGAVAAQAQEDLEELAHVESQEQWL